MPEPQKFLIEITRINEPISEYEILMLVRKISWNAIVKVTRQK